MVHLSDGSNYPQGGAPPGFIMPVYAAPRHHGYLSCVKFVFCVTVVARRMNLKQGIASSALTPPEEVHANDVLPNHLEVLDILPNSTVPPLQYTICVSNLAHVCRVTNAWVPIA